MSSVTPVRKRPAGQIVNLVVLLLVMLVLSNCAAMRGGSDDGPVTGGPGTTSGTTGTTGSGPGTTSGTTGTTGSGPGTASGTTGTTSGSIDLSSSAPQKAVVRVFYGTDRSDGAPRRIGSAYGSGRSTLKFGYVDVSIPRDHRLGNLERPSLLRLEFKENPEKHLTLVEVRALDAANWRKVLSTFSASRSSKRGMVFVHGFNVSFDDAALRAGQLAYDLGFDGVPFLYSWPSVGSLSSYTIDESNVEWTAANLREFLKQAYGAGALNDMVVIAHSMGSRALSRVVAEIASEGQRSSGMMISHLILAAPDIDAEVFARDLLPKMGGPLKVTIYTSNNDKALNASRQLHGYDRLGYTQGGVRAARLADVIDASEVDTSLLGHSYYGDHRSVIADMFGLISLAQPIDKRFGLKRRSHGDFRYWELKP